MFGILTFNGIDITIVFILLALLVVIPIQVLLCFKVRKLWLRLIPIIVSVVLTIACIMMHFISTGWDALGWLFFAIYGVSSIVICAIVWLTWFFIKRFRRT